MSIHLCSIFPLPCANQVALLNSCNTRTQIDPAILHTAHVLLAALLELSLTVWGDGWFSLCALIAQCTTGVQPHPAPESYQSD